jgi:hypothetical protein
MKKVKTKLALTLSVCLLMLLPGVSFAQNYSLGNVDIRLVDGSETIQISGLPGDSFEKQISLKNYSTRPAALVLSTTDANLIKGKFTLAEPSDGFSDSSEWINLSQKNLVLNPGESKTVNINIEFPVNAGVGKHFAGIMASQKTADPSGNLINLETGIRVYANVTGRENGKFKLINPRVLENKDSIAYSVTVLNSGNTNLLGFASLTNQAVDASNNDTNKVLLKPGEDQKINLTIPKTSFGPQRIVSNINIGNSLKTFVLSDKFNIPPEFWIIFGVLMLALTWITVMRRKNKQPVSGQKFREITTFLIIVMVSLVITLNLNNFPFALTQADSLGTGSESAYLVTVKWGNLTSQTLPEWVRTNWDGYLKLNDGQIFVVETLHNEPSDHFSLNNTGDILSFQNDTGPDNDGVIILVKPSPTNSNPVLTVHNILTGEEIPVLLADTVETPRIINYKQHQIKISAEPAPALITLKTGPEDVTVATSDLGKPVDLSPLVTEIQSSPDNSGLIVDLEATPEETVVFPSTESPTAEPAAMPADNSAQIEQEINLLKNLITEIPASPDVVSQYVLNSNYVEEVSSENNTTTIVSSPILIDTLKDTPLTIQELTSTPDLNYIFLPNEKVKLTSQSFSFTEQKISSQELNEIVFVQRKNVPWTAYLSITNLVSVSGNGLIPAENITVNPGKIYVSNQTGSPATIEAGMERKLLNQGDQIVLTTITPNGDGETTFSIRPKISVMVHPNTPPGLYRGTISIKVI